MSSARRSERLRRKRQSTPGLSQPGAYSLYGSGYVVESDASFLPTASTPDLPSRRLRYKHSPHVFDDSSPPPPPPADRARVSLFDILGTPAARPVTNGLHPPISTPTTPVSRPSRVSPQPPTPALSLRPILLLLALLLPAALLTLEAAAHARQLPYFTAAARPPLLRTLLARLPPRPNLLTLPSLPKLPSPRAALNTAAAILATLPSRLLRPAWPPTTTTPRADYVTQSELQSALLPSLMAQARAVAAEEAARVTRELRPPPAVAAPAFDAFAERYAADKGLPPDYALLSVGASVDASSPTIASLYARFARQYVEALFTEGAYTPLLPQRPQAALMPDVLPGNCWAFPGEKGSITIRLARPVSPSSVTIEHTPKRSVFSTLSAPRRFRLLGVPLNASRAAVAQGDMILLGEFTFDLTDATRHLQTFVLGEGNPVPEMRAIKLDILSNHGASHTALYRVRVHGTKLDDHS